MVDLGGGRGWLNAGPAASIFRIDKALGHRMQITEAGRTWAQQNAHWQRYQKYGHPIALHPNTPSVHQKGAAIDTNEGQNHVALLARHGWRRTVYRKGKLVEPWHFEYFPDEDRYRSSTASTGGIAVDGKMGPSTITALQKAVGVTADGKLGPNTVKALQTKLKAMGHKIAVDGDLGPATIRAMQTFIMGAKLADGILGPNTIRALQNYLNSGGKFVINRPKPAPSTKLTVDGKWGDSTTKALQKALGVTQDGKLGPATYTALQKKLVAMGHKIAVDGEMGPATIKALQTYLLGGSKADGKIGPETVKGLQNYLNSGGTFVLVRPTPTPTPPATKLTVDGKWGASTTKAFQTNLKVTADGELGPNTWKAFQKATGQTQDGQPGPNTYKALQLNVGATADGQLGPDTIKKLQEFLNAGKAFKVVSVAVDPTTPTSHPVPAAPTYPGATWWNHSPNSSPRREGDKVQYFVIHHVGASSLTSLDGDRTRFMTANDRSVSPNWLIGRDGSVSEIVPPDKYRAWTTGSFDYNAVTVETQNTSVSPTWGISEASVVAIAKLVVWASKRYGFPIDRQHVIGHREVPTTTSGTICPGPSMPLDRIVEMAKTFAADPTTPPEPVPETPKDEWTITLPKAEAVALAGLLDKLRDLLP